MIRGAAAALAAAATLATGHGATAAATAEPPAGAPQATAGSGEGDGVRIAPLDSCISCTDASAGQGGTRARATALRVAGNDVSGGQSHDGGQGGDAVAALPSNPVLDLAVAGWETDTETGAQPASQSRTALVDAGVLPSGKDATTGGLLTVAVLESFGDATWSGSTSGGYGASNGADIGIDNEAVVIILLHSQSTSDDRGNAYVASVDGTALLGTSGHSPGTPVDVPGVLGLTLLRSGATSSAVGSADHLLDRPGQAAAVLSSAAGGQPHSAG